MKTDRVTKCLSVYCVKQNICTQLLLICTCSAFPCRRSAVVSCFAQKAFALKPESSPLAVLICSP
jgi:hypothetical protein